MTASTPCVLRLLSRKFARVPTAKLNSATKWRSSAFQNLPRIQRHCQVLPARTLTTDAYSEDGSCIQSPHPPVTIPENKSFTEYMLSHLKEFDNLPAMEDVPTGRTFTFKKIQDSSIRLASALYRLGYRKGDTILIFSTNCPEYSILILACGALGVIVTTVNAAYTSGELLRQADDSGAVAVFSQPQLIGTVKYAISTSQTLSRQIKEIFVFGEAEGCRPFTLLLEDDGKAFPENVDIDSKKDPLLIPYSSGTTGMPKGVMLTHYNIIANVQQVNSVHPFITGQDKLLGILPFFHIYGLVVSQFCCLVQGGLLLTSPRFVPEEFLKAIQAYKVTKLHLVPPLAVFLAKDPAVPNFDISSLETILIGAAPLGETTTTELKRRTDAFCLQAYGMTEASPATHVDIPPGRYGTIGPLIPNTAGKVIDPTTGETLRVGESGEMCVRGPQIMKGYLDNPKATSEMIKDGWMHTGDIGHYDEDGRFTITGRLKELIKYKGFQVAPAELETVLLTHPDIQDAAVVGIPDEKAGELPKAFIVLKPNKVISTENISDYVAKNVAPFKKLRGGVEIIDVIPKTASGKIIRRYLIK